MSRDIRILCIKVGDRTFQPLAWTDREISSKKLKKYVHKFRRDSDFIEGAVLEWRRLYNSLSDVKFELPRI